MFITKFNYYIQNNRRLLKTLLIILIILLIGIFVILSSTGIYIGMDWW